MQITMLERAVIEHFLQAPELDPLRSEVDFEKIKVLARDFTGVGFLAHFERSQNVKLFGDDTTLRWGGVGAQLNTEKVESGYVVYIDNGYLTTVEAYTYGDEWPESINSIEFYELKPGMELGNAKPR